MNIAVIPLISCIVSLIFAVTVLDQYFARKKPYQLIWAIYSAWTFWRRRILPHRVVSNILIAVGAILPAFGGLRIRIGGGINLFYVFELLGIIIIFTGFLRSREVFGVYRVPLVHGFQRIAGG